MGWIRHFWLFSRRLRHCMREGIGREAWAGRRFNCAIWRYRASCNVADLSRLHIRHTSKFASMLFRTAICMLTAHVISVMWSVGDFIIYCCIREQRVTSRQQNLEGACSRNFDRQPTLRQQPFHLTFKSLCPNRVTDVNHLRLPCMVGDVSCLLL